MSPRPWLLITALLAGCSQILSLEDAHFDPSTEQAGAAGALPVAGTTAATSGNSSSGQPASEPDAGGSGGRAGEANAAAGAIHEAGAGGGVAVEPSLCERYCAAVSKGCTGEHAQYIDVEACLATCAYVPEGSPGDTEGNTANCRLTYADKAPSEPYTYCTWAGPGGDGRCGSNCEGFCNLMMQTCDEASTGNTEDYFATAAECMSACEGIDDVGSYSATDGALQMGADHVQCRLYHVGAAVAESDPLTHCPHATGRRLCVAPASK